MSEWIRATKQKPPKGLQVLTYAPRFRKAERLMVCWWDPVWTEWHPCFTNRDVMWWRELPPLPGEESVTIGDNA